ncbi:hypothetical protein CXG81DRAFT_24176 [Caulochytrium protostelioides]|uniref:Transcription and mRNA export factor SUS1 n=1 Tax=Caulochytrium protostelioides TaxID=1555241 RepID=A0A4P9XCK6_9FUNG|nr:hypothetical protein CXG81DRAFT_24176 [Caulochytrium protostelioides]|eukprot:RKP03176.1 hypothetical protein CXG81DRAFT_24176 [Caulochytrium protostelioides]
MADLEQQIIELEDKLIENGEHERLKDIIHHRLVESGVRDKLRMHCQDVIRAKGISNVTAEELIAEVTGASERLVPDAVRTEIEARIRKSLQDL